MSLSLPTRYVNVAAAVVYNADLPDPLFRTYARLVGLAWRDKDHGYTHLPGLTLAELTACCHLKPRAMRLHLEQLTELGYITCTGTSASYTIQIQTPGVQSFAQVQSFALPMMMNDHDDVVDPDLNGSDQQQHDGKVQSFALSENLRALQAFGVNPAIPDAQRVAALPHVTPAFIQAWGQEVAAARDTRNLAGRLLYKLQTTQHWPRVETRGGDRRAESGASTDAALDSARAAAPHALLAKPPGLPPVVLDDLARLGFTGPLDEVCAAYVQDPDFVTAWLTHCLTHTATLHNPGGFFRHALRGEVYPPEPLALPPPPAPVGPPSPAAQLWQRILAAVALQMTQATFDVHLRGSQAQDLTPEGTLRVLVGPTSLPWLQGRLAPVIARAVQTLGAPSLKIEFVTAPPAATAPAALLAEDPVGLQVGQWYEREVGVELSLFSATEIREYTERFRNLTAWRDAFIKAGSVPPGIPRWAYVLACMENPDG